MIEVIAVVFVYLFVVATVAVIETQCRCCYKQRNDRILTQYNLADMAK